MAPVRLSDLANIKLDKPRPVTTTIATVPLSGIGDFYLRLRFIFGAGHMSTCNLSCA